jgi:GH35 family endo-1,4-beta-xylanase
MGTRTRLLHYVVAFLMAAMAICAGYANSDIARADPTSLVNDSGWRFNVGGGGAAVENVGPNIPGPAQGLHLHVTVQQPSTPFYLIQLTQALSAPVAEYHIVKFHFYASSPTHNTIRAVIEQNSEPWTSVEVRTITLTDKMREYTLAEDAPAAFPAGLAARFQVGQQAGTIDIIAPKVEDMGVDPGVIAAEQAVEPAAEQSRIRTYRMSDLTIVAKDANGHAIKGASVAVRQQRHAFLFGCNIFGLNTDDKSPLETAYQQKFQALFNYATLPFYWGSFEHTKGQPNYDKLMTMAQWCVAHGISPKGHPLVWHEVWPSWAPDDPDAAVPLLNARVHDLVSHYKGVIRYWDVVNEASHGADYSPANGESKWLQRDGNVAVVGTCLGWARDAGAGAPETFTYNDYETGQANVDLIAGLKAAKKLPDVIGIQSHMHGGEWPMTKVWTVCQRFAQFGLPIHFTEITVLSGPKRARPNDNGPAPTDWLTTPAGEAEQADYVAQFYTLLFSHPNLRAITWWDFSDKGAWLNAPAGLLRADMTSKPAYDKLMDLIHRQWWTNADGVTNRDGAYKVHAFYGGYQVTVTDSKGHKAVATVSMPEESGSHTVTVTVK